MEQILDSGDKEALEELQISPGYLLVKQRIEESIGISQRLLETDLDPVMTAKVRGEIESLRMVLRIPGYMISEVRK